MTRNLMLHYMALPFVFQSINFPTMNLKMYRLKIFKLRIQLFKYHPRRDKSPRKKISVWNDLTEPFCRLLLSRFFAQPRADIRSIRDGIKSDQPARIRGWLYRNWGREEERKIRCFAENFYVIRRFFWTVSFALIQLFSFCFMLIGGFSTILLANFAASSFLSKPIKRKSKFQELARFSHLEDRLAIFQKFWISSRCYPIFVGIWRLYRMNELLSKEGKNSKEIKTASQSLSQWIIQSRRKLKQTQGLSGILHERNFI